MGDWTFGSELGLGVLIAALGAAGCAGNFTEKVSPCDEVTCSGRGQCVVSPDGQAGCLCQEGYQPLGPTCVANCLAVDCSLRGGCIVVDGDPICTCDQGFWAVGLECRPAPLTCGGVECSGRGVCIEVDGEPACICQMGFAPIGLSCVPAACSGVSCSGRGGCIVRDGAPSCICDFSFEPVGLGCRPADCSLIDCGAGACVTTDAGPECQCDHNHVAVGFECRPVPCELEDCSGHGTCLERDGELRCHCQRGYVAVGMSCLPGCRDLDCGEHGTCIQTGGDVSCYCETGFESYGSGCRRVSAGGEDGGGEPDGGAERDGGVESDGGDTGTAADGGSSVDSSFDGAGDGSNGGTGEDGGDSGGPSDGSTVADSGHDSGDGSGSTDGGAAGDSGDGGGGEDSGEPIDSGSGEAGSPPEAPGPWVLIDVSGTPFLMGSPDTELGSESFRALETQHEVTLTRDYWLMAHEITQQQYLDVMGYNPSDFSASGGRADCGLNCPVEMVNWHEIASYANTFSGTEGLGECYDCTGTAPATINCSASVSYATPYDCPGYRLPMEAEWEYAARGGATTATYGGDLTATDCSDTTVGPIAWFCGNASNTTHPVGLKTPNAYGLFDMLGNVYEWCHDWYGTYPSGPVTDPLGATRGSSRVPRGGSWNYGARGARAAYRGGNGPAYRGRDFGGRAVRSVL